jgi:hypothetical protein
VQGSPTNFTDPSGLCRDGDTACETVAKFIEDWYKVEIDRGNVCDEIFYGPPINGLSKYWMTEELLTVEKSLNLIATFLDSGVVFRFNGTIGGRGYVIRRVQTTTLLGYENAQITRLWEGHVWTELPDAFFQTTQQPWQHAIVVHEVFHAFDFLNGYISRHPAFSQGRLQGEPLEPDPNTLYCGPTVYACTNLWENFADSAMVYALDWLRQRLDNQDAKDALAEYENPSGMLTRYVDEWNDKGSGFPWGGKSMRRATLGILFFNNPEELPGQ